MKGIKNENDGMKGLHGIRRNAIRRNGKTPPADLVTESTATLNVVTHSSSSRARRGVTSLIETNTQP